jgi:hypothetical protein
MSEKKPEEPHSPASMPTRREAIKYMIGTAVAATCPVPVGSWEAGQGIWVKQQEKLAGEGNGLCRNCGTDLNSSIQH